MAPKKIPIHKSSGNVFADIGFPPGKAAHLLVRSDLMIEIERALKGLNVTQKEVAKLLGVTQPRVSALLRHRIDLFSSDALIEMATQLGIEVTLKTKRRSAPASTRGRSEELEDVEDLKAIRLEPTRPLAKVLAELEGSARKAKV